MNAGRVRAYKRLLITHLLVSVLLTLALTFPTTKNGHSVASAEAVQKVELRKQ